MDDEGDVDEDLGRLDAAEEQIEDPADWGVDYPIHTIAWGHAVPDLAKVPEDRWFDVLLPLPRGARTAAVNSAPSDRIDKALAVAGRCLLEGDARRDAVRRVAARPPVVPEPPPVRALLRGAVQVNVRLRRSDHADLAAAADLLSMTPTALARMFMLGGARKVLAEGRRRGEEGGGSSSPPGTG